MLIMTDATTTLDKIVYLLLGYDLQESDYYIEALSAPNNGAVSYTSTIQDSVATYSCLAGFQIDGVTSRTCSAVTPKGWSGVAPSCIADIDECNNTICGQGVCTDLVNDFSCACNPGYMGTDCSTEIDECSSLPCVNGGTCVDLVNQFKCNCTAGYTGIHCADDANHCDSNRCQNNAICENTANGYFCLCAEGYFGKYCQTRSKHTAFVSTEMAIAIGIGVVSSRI
ncbi:SNED1-like protein [Mya arenaria]|uniref:SNED1-like protein n=1 Tax=Mya arenaria TaxID=6604 RepID=A0ABY7EHW6_MYAAR|nr:SNED1-like protein [Mya arenaria]